MSLQGKKALTAKLRALKVQFKPIGRNWADDTVRIMKPRIPVGSGVNHKPGPHTRDTVRVRNSTQKKATVVASYKAFFIDKGTKAHTETARHGFMVFPEGGRTIFAKKVHKPRMAARPFRERSAQEALRKNPMAVTIINAWNKAR